MDASDNSNPDSDVLTHVGILTSAEQYMFISLQMPIGNNKEAPVAFVDGPYRLYDRLDNRNWRAGDSYCSGFDSETVARLLAYWSI